jgi:SAM-dependent methyltransferase
MTSSPPARNAEWLNVNQSPEELADLYGEQDYYWYLRSPQFAQAFTKPLARLIDSLGPSCLDAGCGEGQLADHIGYAWAGHRYVGIDGSATALARGVVDRPHATLVLGRIEDPPVYGRFDTVVFSGVLEVLIKPEARVPLLELYAERYQPSHFVVCDLMRLDATAIARRWPLIQEVHRTAEGIDVIEAKRHRKILVFRCE